MYRTYLGILGMSDVCTCLILVSSHCLHTYLGRYPTSPCRIMEAGTSISASCHFPLHYVDSRSSPARVAPSKTTRSSYMSRRPAACLPGDHRSFPIRKAIPVAPSKQKAPL